MTFGQAMGMGFEPGKGGADAALAERPAYRWFDSSKAKGGEEHTLSFAEAHRYSAVVATKIRAAAAMASKTDTMFTVGLVLKRSAALPLCQLAAFKAGATFVPCDPTWPV